MVDAVDGSGLIAVLVFVACVSAVLYVVVRGAILSAMRKLRREDAAKSGVSP